MTDIVRMAMADAAALPSRTACRYQLKLAKTVHRISEGSC